MDSLAENLLIENRELRARVAELEERDARQEVSTRKLQERIAELEKLLDEARRAGKRQAAPFRQAEPKADPQTPGRKAGKRHGRHAHRAPPPEAIDEHCEAPLPDRCPHCGGTALVESEVVVQYQTEIPRRPIHRQFTIHRGQCRDCGQTVQGRHALQTSDAVGAAASQLGPQAHAAMTVLNKELGLSHGKVSRVFQSLFGISLARATSARSLLRTARRCGPEYQAIRGEIRGSSWVVPDETGWRVGGRNAWLHTAVAPSATCYEIAPGRDHEVLSRILGEDWQGTLIHDGYKAYDYLTRVFHQQCLHHLCHRCETMLETAAGMAARFPRQVLELVDTAFSIRRLYRGHRLSAKAMADEGLRLGGLLEELAGGHFTYEPNRRLAKHLLRHPLQWFRFLIDPQIDATNYRAEQALRPAVVNRKVWGGNRTWNGAEAQSILTSVLRTCAQKGRKVLDYLIESLCSPRPGPLLAYER